MKNTKIMKGLNFYFFMYFMSFMVKFSFASLRENIFFKSINS
jgi:hypothetical protein